MSRLSRLLPQRPLSRLPCFRRLDDLRVTSPAWTPPPEPAPALAPVPPPEPAPARLPDGVAEVRAFHRRGLEVPGEDAVTLVTQLSSDRLPALACQLAHWPGPISAALLLGDPTGDLHAAEEWWLTSPGAMARVDLHLVAPAAGAARYPANALRNIAVQHSRTQAPPPPLVPATRCRPRGHSSLIPAPLQVVLVLDVDLVPFHAGLAAFRTPARRLRREGPGARRAYVVPAFEETAAAAGATGGRGAADYITEQAAGPRAGAARALLDAQDAHRALARQSLDRRVQLRISSVLGGGLVRGAPPAAPAAGLLSSVPVEVVPPDPHGGGGARRGGAGLAEALEGPEKRALQALWAAGGVAQVHGAKFAGAHAPTDYARWFATRVEYAVSYQSEYEPYVLARKDMPAFDERFRGYGGDKTSHAYELARAGHVLVVLPDAFAVHAAHAPAPWASESNWTRAWMDWVAFVEETNERYAPARGAAPPDCPQPPPAKHARREPPPGAGPPAQGARSAGG